MIIELKLKPYIYLYIYICVLFVDAAGCDARISRKALVPKARITGLCSDINVVYDVNVTVRGQPRPN